MITVVAIDDEPLALELLKGYCTRCNDLHMTGAFTSTIAARDFLEVKLPDLLLLDINMPAISGLSFYRGLPTKPLLILTTSYAEYAVESYELDAIDYLLKPFSFQRFEKAINRVRKIITPGINPAQGHIPSLIVKADYGVTKVNLSDIQFIEGLDNYLRINLVDRPPLVVRQTLKSLAEQLDKQEFVRVHRSYIVALRHITQVKSREVRVGNNLIPIGKNFEPEVSRLLRKHF